MAYKYTGHNYLDIDIGEYNNHPYLITVHSFTASDTGGVTHCPPTMMTINQPCVSCIAMGAGSIRDKEFITSQGPGPESIWDRECTAP